MSVLGWLGGKNRAGSNAAASWPAESDRPASRDTVTTPATSSGSTATPGASRSAATDSPSAAAAALGAPATGLTGEGVKIGVISDSFDALGTAAADEADGALPPGVAVLNDSSTGHDEGRAMAEVAHGVAPGASIAFSAAGGSEAGLAASIAALQAAGCTVICDDVTYPNEPFFQMGDAAEQAISAFTAAGGVYFTAASNAGAGGSYQNSFSGVAANLPGVGAVTAANFGTAAAPQTTDTLQLKAHCPTTVDLQWAQPWASIDGAGSAYSLAFAVYDPSGALVKAVDADKRGGDPLQSFTFTPAVSGAYTVSVWLNGGADAGGTFKIVANNSNTSGADFGDESGNTTAFGGSAGSGSIYGHNMDPDAITVGAVDLSDTPAAGGTLRSEAFSAAGPGEELYSRTGAALATPKVLHGVAVSGPDGIATTLPASDLDPFHGTSCATPAVAAVGALMKEANPSMDAGEVKRDLEGTATAFGARDQAGAGFAQAGAAVALARESNTTIRDDFFGDGQTALLWQDGKGGAELADVRDDAAAPAAALAGPGGAGWTAVASGDFSGLAGHSDVLWRDDAGALSIAAMSGSSVTSRTPLGSPGAGWQVAGTGDFSGDGNSDILFDDKAGDAEIWAMDGTDVTARKAIEGPGAGWSVAGIGDLDGDGRSDVVWQDRHGDLALWIMQGTSVASEMRLAGPGAGWSVAGVGDLSGDGRADILFQDAATGALDLWTMDGTEATAKTALASGLGAGWQAAGVGEFDASGRDGILFQDAATGAASVAELRHGQISSIAAVATPGAGWSAMLG